MGKERALALAAVIEANLDILEAAGDSITRQQGWESFCEEQEWEFRCQCGDRACQAHVKLTFDSYGAVHDAGCVVLAPGHSPSQIERARQLRNNSKALRAQAQHQVERAGKNLRDARALFHGEQPRGSRRVTRG